MKRLPVLALVTILSACTPQQALMSALIPEGTASVLLGHLEGVADANRRHIAGLEQRGAWAELAAFADSNIRRDPFSPEWRLVGGYAHVQLKDSARASVYFAEMLRLAPDDPSAYHFLANAQRVALQPQLALKTLDRALLVQRDNPLTWHLLGEVYGDLGRFAEAAAAYRMALREAPRFAAAWSGLGRTALRLGRAAEAQEALAALESLQSPEAAKLKTLMSGP
jgi:tetratricopeptide (TPR) repeat protein